MRISSSESSFFFLERYLDDLTELFLLLPVIIWVANWIAWPLALPICIGLTWVYFRHFRERRAECSLPPFDGAFRHLSLPGIIISLLIAAGITFLNGFDGRVLQSGDFIVRNAVYGELISSPWPLILEDGSFVVYAIQFWLPPALIASHLPEWKTPILQCWVFVGLLLIQLQLVKLLGWKRALLFMVCLMTIWPLSNNYIDRVTLLNIIPSALQDSTATYHFYILGSSMIVMMLSPQITYPRLLFCSALLFVSAPLTAAFFAPVILWNTWQVMKEGPQLKGIVTILKMPELYVGIGIVGCQLVFSSSATGAYLSLSAIEQSTRMSLEENALTITLSALLTFIPALLAYFITKEKFLLYVGGFPSACVLICITGEGEVNELLFKTSTAYCFFLTYFLVKHFKQPTVRAYALLLVCLSIPSLWWFFFSSKKINKAIKNGFEATAQNVVDPWGSQMYQPDAWFYERLVSHQVKFPILFQRHELINKGIPKEAPRSTPASNTQPPANTPISTAP